jgi:hypothetical protein
MSNLPYSVVPGCRRYIPEAGGLVCDCQPGQRAGAHLCAVRAQRLYAKTPEASALKPPTDPPSDADIDALVARSRYSSLNRLVRLALHQFAGHPLPPEDPRG